jgi:FlaA1/EpsC-like NDP-sugar epimerase
MNPRRLLQLLESLPRSGKQIIILAIDIAVLLLCGWLAFYLRLGDQFYATPQQLLLIAASPLIAIPIFIRFGLYRAVIRFMGEYALWMVVKAMTLAALLWAVLAFMIEATGHYGMPRSVPFIFWVFAVVTIAGVRFSARWLLWLPMRRRYRGRQAIIYGAGHAGRQLAASLQQGSELLPLAFIDDNAALHGTDIAGLRVYGPEQIPMLIESYGISDIIVTLPQISGARRREIVSQLENYPLQVRILPALSDIASGRHLVNMVREVDIGDLLGRDPVVADPALMGANIRDKVVMVTGAGGSIGSELCQQIMALAPAKLIMLEVSEHALYQIDRSLRRQYPSGSIISALGSVTHCQRVGELITTHRVATIFHAAAYKHVPLVEENPVEGVVNNLYGSETIAEAAFTLGVEHLLLISTDKAVRPTNIMGATKRWAELVVQHYAQRAALSGSGQRFSAVRFGNVLGSSGSVIPLFNEQIRHGGPVTVTHREVTRYFMSIHEAVQLVLQASFMARGGEIFLLDMGEAVRIIDLARNMIRLAGHIPKESEEDEGDIAIAITGLRPGEKLYEELLISSSNAEGTSHPKIMLAREPMVSEEQFVALLGELRHAVANQQIAEVRRLLMQVADGTAAA